MHPLLQRHFYRHEPLQSLLYRLKRRRRNHCRTGKINNVLIKKHNTIIKSVTKTSNVYHQKQMHVGLRKRYGF